MWSWLVTIIIIVAVIFIGGNRSASTISRRKNKEKKATNLSENWILKRCIELDYFSNKQINEVLYFKFQILAAFYPHLPWIKR